jgi:CDP-6-deoxy-D-xylo-4-hexulose-3-dehydrase
MKKIWPLASNSWGYEETRAITDVVESGQLTMGKRVKELEQEFANTIGSVHAIMVNSGSSANLLAVAALTQVGYSRNMLRPGDEVLVPAIAWATTYAPLHQYGLKMKVVDVNLHTLNMSPDALEKAITDKTRLIVTANILGNPHGVDVISWTAENNAIWLLEDNCESMGAKLVGKYAGTFGNIGTFSTFFSHHMNTVEGGFLVTDSKQLAQAARCMRAHGWTRDLEGDEVLNFESEYNFILPGYNVRPTEFAAAAGLVQLKKFSAMQAIRKMNWERFLQAFLDDERFILQCSYQGAVPFGFTMIAKDGERGKYLEAMRKAGVEYRMITGGNIARHPVAKIYGIDQAHLPNADIAHNCGWFVGNHPYPLDGQIAALKQAFTNV